MAYEQFEKDKPDVAGTINDLATDTRNNLMTLRDMVVTGSAFGWNFLPFEGTAEQPAALVYSNPAGGDRIVGSLTWGTTGGEDGNVTVEVWAYIPDYVGAPATSEAIGTHTISYDTDGNVTGTVWS